MKIINVALTSLRRSPYQSLAAFLMTTLTFFVVTIFAILVFSTQNILNFFETRPQVTAFFRDSAKEEDIKSLQDKLTGTGLVQDIKYISKQDALEIYKHQNQDNALLLEMVTADILPASLEVSGKNVKDLEEIATTLKNDTNVEEVIYQKDVADTLRKWVDGIRLGGLALVIIFLLGSLVTLIIILGMRVSSRRSEIRTLSLLGASGWYIRAPFLIEGLSYVMVGTVVGWVIANVLVLYLTPNLLDFFVGMNVFPLPIPFIFLTLGGEVVVASILGLLASYQVVRRYGR